MGLGEPRSKVTRILKEIEAGDHQATDRLLSAIYNELRRLAANKLAQERPGHTLQPTALVHEAYLRLLGDEHAHWDSRGHFFAAAAEAMRRILVEAARRKARLKHGGGRQRCELDETDAVAVPESLDLVALDEAPQKLAAVELVSGRLIGTCMPRHRQQEWLKFLKRIDAQTPAELDLHLIDAAEALATVGEMMETLKGVYGQYDGGPEL